MKIIECIPNFSEGRRPEVIKKIVDSITAVAGIILLDCESDANHNRSVVSFAGSPDAVIKAAFAGCKTASELIDLNNHRGEHPRMGATDVIPLVPLEGVSIEECIEYSKDLGAMIADKLKIPVYLYEMAATREDRKNLAEIRKGEFEGIKAEIGKNPARKPDFGPEILGAAGACAVGARMPLIAYNINLKTKDLKIAKAIARKIRFSAGGLPNVKALGFGLENKGIVQVSINLTNYQKTSVHQVFDAVNSEAKITNTEILESEIIGLIPENALFDAAKHYLKATQLKKSQILERELRKKIAKNTQGLESFLDAVASNAPAHGGGAVSALVGSLAAALASMVNSLTIGKKRFENVATEIRECRDSTEIARKKLFSLIEADTKSYLNVIKAYKFKPDDDYQKQTPLTNQQNLNSRETKIEEALKSAANVPLAIAETCATLLKTLEKISEIGNPNAISDCGVALYLIEAAIKGSILNVKINLKQIKDQKFIAEKLKAIEQILHALYGSKPKIESFVLSKL